MDHPIDRFANYYSRVKTIKTCLALSPLIVDEAAPPLIVVWFSTMAHKGKATLWRSWSLTSAFLLVCLARLTQSYNLRKALGRNRENGHEGKVLFGNFFEKGRTGLPTSIHANWNVTSSAEDAIGYQKDSSGTVHRL